MTLNLDNKTVVSISARKEEKTKNNTVKVQNDHEKKVNATNTVKVTSNTTKNDTKLVEVSKKD